MLAGETLQNRGFLPVHWKFPGERVAPRPALRRHSRTPRGHPVRKGRGGDRNHGQSHDDQHDRVNRVGDPGDATEEHAHECHGDHPGDGAEEIPAEEASISHVGGAGGEGDVGAHNGDEAAEDQGNGATGSEESLGLVEAVGAQDAGVVLEQAAPVATAQVGADLVAKESRDGGNQEELPDVQAEVVAQDRRGDQEGVAGEEGEEDTGFDEDDPGKAAEEPRAELVEEGSCIKDVHIAKATGAAPRNR